MSVALHKINVPIYYVYASEMQAKKIIKLLHDFLVKVVTRYILIDVCYEKSQNVNFLALIRSYVLLA